MENITQALEMSALLADLRAGRVNIVAAVAEIELELRKRGLATNRQEASAAASRSAAAIESGKPRPLEGLPVLADAGNPFAAELQDAGAIILGPTGPQATAALAAGNVALAIGDLPSGDLAPHALCGLWRQGYGIVARDTRDIATAVRSVTALRVGTPITRVAVIPVEQKDRPARSAFQLAANVLKGMHLKVETRTSDFDGNTLNEQQALLAAVEAILLPDGVPHPGLPTMLLQAGYLPKGQAVLLRLVARPGNSEGLLELALALAKALGWKREPA